MHSTKSVLLAIISQAPIPYGNAIVAPNFALQTEADCSLAVQVDANISGVDYTNVHVLASGATGTLTLILNNQGTTAAQVLMPQVVTGITFPYGWTNFFPTVPAGQSVSVQADFAVTALTGAVLSFNFGECPPTFDLAVGTVAAPPPPPPPPPPATFNILMESSGSILLESGDHMILES